MLLLISNISNHRKMQKHWNMTIYSVVIPASVYLMHMQARFSIMLLLVNILRETKGGVAAVESLCVVIVWKKLISIFKKA